MQYRTTAAYVSGTICGHMWMPAVMAGKPVNASLLQLRKRYTSPASFRDMLNTILSEQGGDFQDAAFSSDTVIRVERVAHNGPGRRQIHVREIPVSAIDADYVHADVMVCDFLGDYE